MVLEIIVIVGTVLIVLSSMLGCGYALHRSSRMFDEAKKDYVELLSQTIDNLKAQSLQERYEAKAIEKETDVRIEMLKDAIRVEKSTEEAITEPRLVTTADGREIDLNNYEIV
tara:strand:- start:148 stop:486 length:339 start_codon:yes stop_codon:yes gene_type:complete